MSRVVKQLDNWSCAACVAAMITGETLKDVVAFIGHDGSAIIESSLHPDKRIGFCRYELDSYLMSKGYSFSNEFDLYEPDAIGKKKVSCELNLTIPMYLVVKSESLAGHTHAVYWDGENVCDPSPEVCEHKSLDSYEVERVLPVWKYNEIDVRDWHNRKYHNNTKEPHGNNTQ